MEKDEEGICTVQNGIHGLLQASEVIYPRGGVLSSHACLRFKFLLHCWNVSVRA
jgi:hypothetical protein